MKGFILLVLVLTTCIAVGQVPQWTDLKLFAGQSFDEGNDIKVDNKGNYYLAVSSQNPLSSFDNETLPEICNFTQPIRGIIFQGAVFRFDSTRHLDLSLIIEEATLGDIEIDSAGNIYVSGVFQYGVTRDAFIKKYTSNGDLIWTKLVESFYSGRNDDDVITSLDMHKDGSIALSGFSYGNDVSILGKQYKGPISFVTRINSNGEVIWTQNFGSDLGIGAYRVKFDLTGDVLVTGDESNNSTTAYSAIIAKLRLQTGEIIWKKKLHSNSSFVPIGMAISTADDHYVFGGQFGDRLSMDDTTIQSYGGLDIFLLQCDKDGNVQWFKNAGSTGRETIYDLVSDKNGATYLTGGFSDGFQMNGLSYSSKGHTDVYIGALNSNGETLWMLTGGSNVPGNKDDLFYDENGVRLAVDSKGQLQVIGTTRGNGNFGSLKYNVSDEVFKNAFWLTLGNRTSHYTFNYPCDRMSVLDTTLSLRVYPNPFFQSLTISNMKALNLAYQLTLYNGIGQKLDEKKISAADTITIDDWNWLAAGLYLLKIDSGLFSQTIKLLKE